MTVIRDLLDYLDPKNTLQARDWIAIFGLLFTVASFITAQYLTARSQKITRELAARPYFSWQRMKRKIDLSTTERGIEKGSILATSDYITLFEANKDKKQINGTSVDNIFYFQVRNLGPSFALDCKFEITSVGLEDHSDKQWVSKANKRIINKDEYVYIPLDSTEFYPLDSRVREVKLTFKTQLNETIIVKQIVENDSEKTIIYKKILWGLFDKKIIELSGESRKGRVIS